MATVEERLAVVETTVSFIQHDVAEIKTDVKSLLNANAGHAGILTLIRTSAPWVSIAIAGVALALSITGG